MDDNQKQLNVTPQIDGIASGMLVPTQPYRASLGKPSQFKDRRN